MVSDEVVPTTARAEAPEVRGRGAPSSDTATGGATVPVTIVIVDDNEGTRSLLRALAERDSQLEVVGEAGDGLEAVVVARQTQPDVVILDIMMPIVGGLEAIPDLLEVSPATRIIGYSAFPGHREEALALGAHGWITKGNPWDVLAERIVTLVAERDATSDAGGADPLEPHAAM